MTFDEIMMKYTVPVIVMSVIVMALVGIIKIFTKVIPNRNNKESKLSKVMSHLYVVIVPVVTAGVIAGYFGIYHLDFTNWQELLKYFASVWSCTQALYPIYRDCGGRTLFVKFVNLFKGKHKKIDKIIEIINNVIPLETKQIEKLEEDFKDKL